MPALYEKMRDQYEAAGKPEKTAKKLAAMSYNAQRAPGTPPVTRNYEKTVENYLHGAKRR